MLATRDPGSVLVWRRCDTLCTSDFVDDVMFAHNGFYEAGDTSTSLAQTYSPDGFDMDQTPRRIIKHTAPDRAAPCRLMSTTLCFSKVMSLLNFVDGLQFSINKYEKAVCIVCTLEFGSRYTADP